MAEKRFSLKEVKKEYNYCWNYIKDSRKFIYAAIFIFLLSAFAGFFIPVPESVADMLTELILEMLKQTQNLSFPELAIFIFFNNLQSTFFAIFLGIFLGIFPFVSAFINGYLLGFVSLITFNEAGIFELWRIFPHGIFELPAVFISLGLGLRLWTFVLKKDKLYFFKKFFFNSVRVFFYIIIPLLLIAAIIESTLIFLG